MRKQLSTLLFCLLASFGTQAQSPQAIPYQAVARDNAGNLIAGQSISLRFSIHSGTANGTVVYSETQTALTNNLGLFAVNIGQGTPIGSSLSSVSWGSGPMFTQVEMDPTGGTSYIDMGSQQMLSVGSDLFSGEQMIYANNFSSLKRKNLTSVTPLRFALKCFILELKDSAFALVVLLSKKLRMFSK